MKGKKKTTEEFKKDLAIKNSNIEVLGEYVNSSTPILVKDKICGHEWNTTTPNDLLKGYGCTKCSIKNRKQTFKNNNINKIGERRIISNGEIAEIINYEDNKNITIKVESTNEIINCRYCDFKKGAIKSHFSPTVYGIGITGLEIIRDKNNKLLKSYRCWHSMLTRCYSDKFQNKEPTYKGCIVCKEWLYYPNFKKWYDENYYDANKEEIHLDKDILIKGNKVYSSETCIFAPRNINILFINRKNHRGDYPLGVIYNTKLNMYIVQCSISNVTSNKQETRHLGLYNSVEDAFYKGYKPFKENYIKQVADYYKDKIPIELYDAMYNYIIEITD